MLCAYDTPSFRLLKTGGIVKKTKGERANAGSDAGLVRQKGMDWEASLYLHTTLAPLKLQSLVSLHENQRA